MVKKLIAKIVYSIIWEKQNVLYKRKSTNINIQKVDSFFGAHQSETNHEFDWNNADIPDRESSYKKRLSRNVAHEK